MTKMKKECDTLRRIAAMPEPRHLFILPDWADPVILNRLIQEGYLSCMYQQRDGNGVLHVVMGLQLTAKGDHLAHPRLDWPQLALTGSLAGASFMIMSLLILYFG